MEDRRISSDRYVLNPLSVRHSQTGLLIAALFWGISGVLPPAHVAFSDMFPATLSRWSQVPTPVWGATMVAMAVLAFVGERVVVRSVCRGNRRGAQVGWVASMVAHNMLCAIYATLTVAAVFTGHPWIPGDAVGFVNAMCRPVIWGFIAYLHHTYATLPKPHFDRLMED